MKQSHTDNLSHTFTYLYSAKVQRIHMIIKKCDDDI